MRQVSFRQAAKTFKRLVFEVERTREAVEVLRHGQVAVVLRPATPPTFEQKKERALKARRMRKPLAKAHQYARDRSQGAP